MSENLGDILNESIFPGNSTAFSHLQEYMERGAIAGFTGAGVSVPMFPTWFALLTRLLHEANQDGLITDAKEIADCKRLVIDDPLELASFLEETFTRKIFRSRLADIFRNPLGQFTECQRIIADLKLRGIVTLNYDNGHEVSYSNKGVHANVGRSQDTATLTRWIQGRVFDDANPPILHFHGEVSDPDKMIVTGDDYNEFYSSPLPDSLILQLWRSVRLLVVGFGFSDPFLTRVVEKALRSLDTDTLHFAR